MNRRVANALRWSCLVLLPIAGLLGQSNGALRVTGAVVAGGDVSVQVADNSASVTVTAGGVSTVYEVPPGKTVTVKIPTVAPGTIVAVASSNRPRIVVALEVVSP